VPPEIAIYEVRRYVKSDQTGTIEQAKKSELPLRKNVSSLERKRYFLKGITEE